MFYDELDLLNALGIARCYEIYGYTYGSRRMFKIDIYAKKWAETKYLGYLQKDRLFMDDDFFLYHSANTESVVKNNIQALGNMYSTY